MPLPVEEISAEPSPSMVRLPAILMAGFVSEEVGTLEVNLLVPMSLMRTEFSCLERMAWFSEVEIVTLSRMISTASEVSMVSQPLDVEPVMW